MATLRKKRVESFEIVLEHGIDEQYQYVPGEMMKGVLVVTCNDTIKIQQLTVTLQGEGNVVWEKDQKSAKKRSKFKTKETYLNFTEDLIRPTSSNPSEELEAGRHEFVFYHQLDESLPSSYIGKFGSVTYLIKAQLKPERKYGADAMITNEPFLVLRTYDLSLEPFKLQPYEQREVKSSRICLCGGLLTAFLKLNRTGFVPGEDIRLNADVSNGTFHEITSIQVTLIMVSKFHASNSSVASEQVIGKHEDPYVIDHGEGRRWNDVRLTIPPYIPESGLEGCDIIDINYILLFQVILDYNNTTNQNLQMCIPITIGTHGVRANDNPTEDPELRPLYNKAPDASERPMPTIMMNRKEEDDEMGEIDMSLFDTDVSAKPNYRARYVKKDEKPEESAKEEVKPNPVNFLYGDLVSANDLPDNKLEGTIRDGPKRSKKKRAPQAPTELLETKTSKETAAESSHNEEDLTRL